MIAQSREDAVIDPVADAELLTRVGISLALQFHSSIRNLHPDVRNGEVTLTGHVPTVREQAIAVALVRRVAGVRRVHDAVTVANGHSANRRWIARRLGLHAAAVAILLAVASGCGDSDPTRIQVYPATGSISFRGQPVPGAVVTLHPREADSQGAPVPRANVGRDGKFDVSTYDGGDGAPQGDYVVTIVWFRPVLKDGDLRAGPNVIPRKYARPETSDLRVTIAAGENAIPTIKL